MGQSFQILENIAPLVKASGTTITMASTYLGKDVRITVGGQQKRATSTLNLNVAAANGIGALDDGVIALNTLYYIYAVISSGVLGLVASTSAPGTGPLGFGSWKEVGRFRTDLLTTPISTVVNRLIGNTVKVQDNKWTTFTPVWLSGVVNIQNQAYKYQQVGDSMIVHGYTRMSGVVTGNMYFAVPDGKHLNVDTIITSSNSSILGNVRYLDSGTAYKTISQACYGASNTITFFSDGTVTGWNASTPIVWGNNDVVSMELILPIAEFVGLYD